MSIKFIRSPDGYHERISVDHVELIAAGTCPTEMQPESMYNLTYRICGKPIKRRDRCGVHALVLDRQDDKRASEAAARARRVEADRRRTVASNLAMLLSDQLGVPLSAGPHGDVLTLNVKDAQQLYDERAKLVRPRLDQS